MLPLCEIFETKEKGIIVSIFGRDNFKQNKYVHNGEVLVKT